MQKDQQQVAVFGGGCFWCTEAIFSELKGVVSVMPGYSGPSYAKASEGKGPTYEEVSKGTTEYVEVVEVKFDPAQIEYESLLTVFFATHDSTTLNRQGNDVGTQYRSVIFYTTDKQQEEAEKYIADLNKDSSKRIVTEVKPLDKFYPAEEYHRNYFKNNPDAGYCQVVISPKINKLQEKFQALLRKTS